ncbi:DUF805 domain-containing protein [Caulobacter endophyticus]|uniref:DUF805 domain-containing protein n=1 Tax=Caulobacter endophyticus TaxID=2172652 RepID=A0A2T9K498_9CAUL|nr:DUF805 domain-containing protein [Caulobacter endophyticus]PVM90764.1 hypothetical protein DDF67_10105 [Caulobacter endophyticus]
MIAPVVAYLTGRGERLEYWLSFVGLLVAAFVALELIRNELFADAMDWLTLAVWSAFAARRLRDAGLPFWLAPFPAPIILLTIALNKAFAVDPGRLNIEGSSTEFSTSLFNLGAALLMVGLIVVLGCLPSRKPKAAPGETAEVFG